jgi:hypothetical protein
MSKNYEVPYCATSSTLPSPLPSYVQIFFSEPCSQTLISEITGFITQAGKEGNMCGQ